MVALDARRPASLRCRRSPRDPDEERRAREAQLRRDNRLAERERIEAERYCLGGWPSGAGSSRCRAGRHSVNLPLPIVKRTFTLPAEAARLAGAEAEAGEHLIGPVVLEGDQVGEAGQPPR